MLQRRNFLLTMCLLPLAWSEKLLAAPDEATDLVRRTAEKMIAMLEARRSEAERDPSLIFGMVESIVAPHFDFQRITQGALGPSWNQATPEQQRQLVYSFKQVLIRTYARSLLSYAGEEIRYLPIKPGSNPNLVTVSTEIREPGATPIPVDYRMHRSGDGWRVYDVAISNASLVGNYRNSFSTEIRQIGIDGLIAKLNKMNTQGLN